MGKATFDQETRIKLIDLTRKFANAAIMNDAPALLARRRQMNKILVDFDNANGTDELSTDVRMAERANNAAEYMRNRIQYLNAQKL